MKTIIEVLNSGAEYLAKQGCDESRPVMQHLMAHVLQCDRTYLYTHFDRPLDESILTPLRDLLKRKANGEPLQHLLGSVEFYKREFISDRRALIPRPETEELVEFVLKKTASFDRSLNVLDMGCGSGVIGISLALELGAKASQTTLADISRPALSLALENAMRLGVKISTIQSNLFSSFDETQKFDLIVANLPYIPNNEQLQREVNHDPESALFGGEQGWELIELFLQQAKSFLNDNAVIALEIGHDQHRKIEEILSDSGYSNIFTEKDMSGVARFPFATYSCTDTSHEDSTDSH